MKKIIYFNKSAWCARKRKESKNRRLMRNNSYLYFSCCEIFLFYVLVFKLALKQWKLLWYFYVYLILCQPHHTPQAWCPLSAPFTFPFALCIEKNLIKYELLRTQGKNNGETITKNCPETEKNTLKFPIEAQRDLVIQGNLRKKEN